MSRGGSSAPVCKTARMHGINTHTHKNSTTRWDGGFSLRGAVVVFGFVDSQNNNVRWDTAARSKKALQMKIGPNGRQLRMLNMDMWHNLLFDFVTIQSHQAWIYHRNVPDEPLLSHLALSALVRPTILTTRPWNFNNESCKSSEWFSGSPDQTMMYKNSAEVCRNLRFPEERYDTQRRKLKFPVSMNYLVKLSHLGCTLCRLQNSVWLPRLLRKVEEQKRLGSYFRIFFVSPFLWQFISLTLTVCNHLQILKENRNGVGWGGLRQRRGWGGERWM